MADREEILARLIEEYHRRKAQGDPIRIEDFEEEAGEHFDAFREFVGLDSFIQQATHGKPAESFPRPFGEYTLLGLLGEGGVARVYRAVQRKLSRTVAIKVLHGGWSDDQDLKDRFRRGAKAAAQIEHDHAVRVYDHGFEDGRLFITMSLLEGPTLQKMIGRLKAAGPPPFGAAHHAVLDGAGVPGQGDVDAASYVRRIAAMMVGVADAVAEYDAAGIVHRDIKPGNLMMDDRGRLVLTDFDLAKGLATQFMTRPEHAVGTPAYMSPEQWDPTRDVDGRTDVYALGAVLFELFTLQRSHEALDDAGAFPAEHSAEARRVVMKCLERRPEDRYPNARALADDLRALAAGAPVKARPVPLTRKTRRWVWQRRFVIAACVAMLVFAAIALRPKPGILTVSPVPFTVQLWVDGARHGLTPTTIEVPAGEHELKFALDDLEHVVTVRVEAGEIFVFKESLWTKELGERGLQAAGTQTIPPPSAMRSADELMAILPRGKYEMSGLEWFTVQAYDGAAGRIVIEDGEGNRVGAMGAVAKDGQIATKISAELRTKLEVGRTYRWFYEDSEKGASEPVTFTLVADLELDDAVMRFGKLHAAAYFQEFGLHRRAAVTLGDPPEQPDELRLWCRIYWRSLVALGLTESSVAHEIQKRYESAR